MSTPLPPWPGKSDLLWLVCPWPELQEESLGVAGLGAPGLGAAGLGAVGLGAVEPALAGEACERRARARVLRIPYLTELQLYAAMRTHHARSYS